MSDESVQERAPGHSDAAPPRPSRSPATPPPSGRASGTDRAVEMFNRDPDGANGFIFAMPSVMMSADNMTWDVIRDRSERHGWIRMTHEAHGRQYAGEGPSTVAASLAVLADMLGYVATIVDKPEVR